MTHFGTTYAGHTLSSEGDKSLGLVDFALHPHLDDEWFPENSMAHLEKLAATMAVPSYAIDDQTAIKVIHGDVEVMSEGHWKFICTRGNQNQSLPDELAVESRKTAGRRPISRRASKLRVTNMRVFRSNAR